MNYKTLDRGHQVIVVDRYYPSSKTCSSCGEVRAKLTLDERVFGCQACGLRLDRDVNASRNIEQEGLRLLSIKGDVAGFQPETLNAVSRKGKTSVVRHGHRPLLEQNHAAIKETNWSLTSVVEGVLVTAPWIWIHGIQNRDDRFRIPLACGPPGPCDLFSHATARQWPALDRRSRGQRIPNRPTRREGKIGRAHV